MAGYPLPLRCPNCHRNDGLTPYDDGIASCVMCGDVFTMGKEGRDLLLYLWRLAQEDKRRYDEAPWRQLQLILGYQTPQH